MNIEHYQKFKKYEELGLKKEASKSVRAFISTFDDDTEIENWVWDSLPDLEMNRHSRIRHEIFSELVFPVLKRGYQIGDVKCTMWLGKLIQNIYQAKGLDEELGWVTDLSLFNKCYEIDPSNEEVRLLLLEKIVDWLQYSEHEWPSGILYGNNEATLAECSEISIEIERVLKLDKEFKYSEFIKQYVKKFTEYRGRINK